MPYIEEERRQKIDGYITELIKHMDYMEATPGDLNYVFTKIAIGMNAKRYNEMNAVHGTFFSAAAEYYRRYIAPYEDRKIEINGDVYPTPPWVKNWAAKLEDPLGEVTTE